MYIYVYKYMEFANRLTNGWRPGHFVYSQKLSMWDLLSVKLKQVPQDLNKRGSPTEGKKRRSHCWWLAVHQQKQLIQSTTSHRSCQQSSFISLWNKVNQVGKQRWNMQSCLSLRKQLLQNDVIKRERIRMSRPLLVLMNQLQIFASQQGRKKRQECNHHCAFPFLSTRFMFDVTGGTQVLFLILINKAPPWSVKRWRRARWRSAAAVR